MWGYIIIDQITNLFPNAVSLLFSARTVAFCRAGNMERFGVVFVIGVIVLSFSPNF